MTSTECMESSKAIAEAMSRGRHVLERIRAADDLRTLLVFSMDNGYWHYVPNAVDDVLAASKLLNKNGIACRVAVADNHDVLTHLTQATPTINPEFIHSRLRELRGGDVGTAFVVPYDPTGSITQHILDEIGPGTQVFDLGLILGWRFNDFALQPGIAPCDAGGALSELVALFCHDPASMQTLQQLLTARATQDPAHLQTEGYPQYQHPEVVSHLRSQAEPGVLIDGGTTDGAEIREACRVSPKAFAGAIGFDPDAPQVAAVLRLDGAGVPIYRFKLALGDRVSSGVLVGEGISTRIEIGGPNTNSDDVRVVTIDSMSEEVAALGRVRLLRLDVEGAEMRVLSGAEETIRRDRPSLVVCLYHEPHHLFEIPTYLASILDDYKFYLGHHNANCLYETVLYGVPTAGTSS